MVGAKGLKEGLVELRDRRTKEVVKFKPEATVAEVSGPGPHHAGAGNRRGRS